jgi:hypothetical protein
MRKPINLLINANNYKCAIRSNIVHNFKGVNLINYIEPRYIEYNHLNYEIRNVNGIIISKNSCHHEELLFELGYLYSIIPNIPILYANDISKDPFRFHHRDNKVNILINYFKNLNYYEYREKKEINNLLSNFIKDLYYRNNIMMYNL